MKDEKILKEIIIPGEVISRLYPVVQIKEESAERILRGQPIYKKNLADEHEMENGNKISVFSKERFIGVFKIINEGEIFAKPEFVFQPIGKN